MTRLPTSLFPSHFTDAHSSVLASFPGLPIIQFWWLAVCKTEGEALVHFITWMTSVSTCRQRWGGVPDRKDAFCGRILRFEPRTVRFLLCERSKLQCLGQKLQDQASSLFFRRGTPPPLFLHTASDQKLDGRKAWERGYLCPTWWMWEWGYFYPIGAGLLPTSPTHFNHSTCCTHSLWGPRHGG